MGRNLVLLAFLLSSIALPAQQGTSPANAPEAINLDVVVTPGTGAPVANLKQQDFTVFDNKTPVSVTSFHADNGQTPIHIVLLIDAVNTSYENLATERDQISKFLRSDGGRIAQPTQLAFLTDTGTQIQKGFSTDGNALNASLEQFAIGLRNIHRSSQYGAQDRFKLSMSALQQLVQREAALPGRKLIFWVSPGWPLLSGPGIELDSRAQEQTFATVVKLSTELRKGRITVYGVDPLGSSEGLQRTFYYQSFLKGVANAHHVEVGDLGLQVLATQSGGLALSSSNDVASLLQRCIADTKAFYELSFQAPVAEHRDEYHRIEIKMSTPGLTARTRQGYYAQP